MQLVWLKYAWSPLGSTHLNQGNCFYTLIITSTIKFYIYIECIDLKLVVCFCYASCNTTVCEISL